MTDTVTEAGLALLEVLDAADSVLRGDFYYERKNLRAAILAMRSASLPSADWEKPVAEALRVAAADGKVRWSNAAEYRRHLARAAIAAIEALSKGEALQAREQDDG